MVREITSREDFDTIARDEQASLCYFWATWCGPCTFIAPTFEQLSTVYTQRVLAKIDVDAVPEVAEVAVIRAMPTFQVWQSGHKIGELVGANPQGLEALCQRHLR